MGQKKLLRFRAIKTFSNVLEYPQDMQGRWSEFFVNTHPITLELACGKGEYTIGMARLFPDKNFIGLDIKGNRIWAGAKTGLEEKLQNAAFLRTHIDKIETYFAPGEVDEIWITFPDPQLALSRAKKRLTHPNFLRRYQRILKPGGLIHLKTDSPDLYEFTKLVIELYGLKLHEDNDNIYAGGDPGPVLSIKTHYEKLDIAASRKVHYLQFSLPDSLPADHDAVLKERLAQQATALTVE